MNRKQRREQLRALPSHLRSVATPTDNVNRMPVLPASAMKLTRIPGDAHVLVGIEQPGYVQLSISEAIDLADSLLDLARSHHPSAHSGEFPHSS